MEKKRKAGAAHYKGNLGLKPILVYVEAKAHAKLLILAEKEGSLQKLTRKLLEQWVYRAKNCRRGTKPTIDDSNKGRL